MADYQYPLIERDDGAIIGSTSTSLIGFYGATPVAQQTSCSAISTTTLATVIHTATTGGYGFTTTTDGANLLAVVTELVAAVNLLKTAIDNTGLAA